MAGHLACRVEIHGDDAWGKDSIELFVRYSHPSRSADTPDGWTEDKDWTQLKTFDRDVPMSTDPREGVRQLILKY